MATEDATTRSGGASDGASATEEANILSEAKNVSRRRSETTEEKLVGKVTHYYSKLGVAIVELSETLMAGDEIHIKGATTDLTQTVDSMEVERKAVREAKAGDAIGIKVGEKVRDGDKVFLAATAS